MILAIHQPQYMPWVGYFHKMASAASFVFLDDAQYKKNEWIHRNRIRNPEGWQWLSVPSSYRFPERICDVTVGNSTGWQKKHLRSLEMCYGKSPHFASCIGQIRAFYAEEYATLDVLNIQSVALLSRMLGISVPTYRSSELAIATTATQRLVDICIALGADTYLAGAGGHDYMELDLFDKAGISVEFQKFVPVSYKQHWCSDESPFIAGLSALDLIFNCGPESLSILMG